MAVQRLETGPANRFTALQLVDFWKGVRSSKVVASCKIMSFLARTGWDDEIPSSPGSFEVFILLEGNIDQIPKQGSQIAVKPN